MEAVALVASLGSAVGVAVSTSLQHQAAGQAPARVRGAGRLLLHLACRPRWIAAQTVSLTSFCLHAVALRLGSLAVVQPVVVSGMVLAVPVRAALNRRPPAVGELRSVVLTGVGLAVFLIASGSVVASPARAPSVGLVALVSVVTAAAVAVVIHQMALSCAHRGRQAALLGTAAGVLFGLAAGLLKLVVLQSQAHGVLAALSGWPAWALVMAGAAGSAVNQRAYRAGALSASMPLLNVLDVLVALGFGLVVLGETPSLSLERLTAQGAALACIGAGLYLQAKDSTVSTGAPPPRPGHEGQQEVAPE